MLGNLDDALKEIERASIRTSQGSFVKVEDVKRLLQERQQEEEKPKPQPKNMNEAKRMAARDKDIFPPQQPREAGRSVPAGPQPPSRA